VIPGHKYFSFLVEEKRLDGEVGAQIGRNSLGEMGTEHTEGIGSMQPNILSLLLSG
jgi:hypothetical protein